MAQPDGTEAATPVGAPDAAPSGDPTIQAPDAAPDGTPVDVDVPVDVEVEEAVPDELSDGDATAVPDLFFWALWIGVFAVLLWGMMVLFRRRAPDDR